MAWLPVKISNHKFEWLLLYQMTTESIQNVPAYSITIRVFLTPPKSELQGWDEKW
jgi:hypothetical protein